MKMMTNLLAVSKYISLAIGCLAISSCSVFSPVKLKPDRTYIIDSEPAAVVKKRKRNVTLLVMKPDTVSAYDTKEMAYTRKPFEVNFYTQSHWVERPEEMLQPLIVDTLQRTHYFHAIVSPPFSGRYNYILNTQILKLEQDFTQTPAILKFYIRTQLTKASSNRILNISVYKIEQPIQACSAYSGVIAANIATVRFLRALSMQTIRTLN
ncbi:MAG: membrane integrity-associated transporter subunit PqiC [Gammaproteobacteria bacterium]|nr:membrane integrity-associated transporter subunit PqiC [Gammaproteobacteria bacterium]